MNTFNIEAIKAAFSTKSNEVAALENALDLIDRRANRTEHKQASRTLNYASDVRYNLSVAMMQSKNLKDAGREHSSITIDHGPTIDFLESIINSKEVTFINADINAQDETINYWFDVSGENYALSVNGGEMQLLDCDGCPVDPRNDHENVKQLLIDADPLAFEL